MRAFVSLLIIVAAGCSSPFDGPLVCTDELRSTLALRIVNASSGAPEGAGSTVVVRRAGVYDSVRVVTQFSQFDYLGWEDRIGAGTYSVSVRKPGFVRQDFAAEVTADRCHAGPGPQIEVRLVPAP